MVNISAPSAILGRNFCLITRSKLVKDKGKNREMEKKGMREKGSFELLVVIPNGVDFHATDR